MGIAIEELGLEIESVARSFLESHDARGAARQVLEGPSTRVPAFWTEMAELGWLGLHLPEELGGQGAGLSELAVIVEGLGAQLAPGPFLPTVLTSAVLAASATDDVKRKLLPGLADGSALGTVGLAGNLQLSNGAVSGDAGLVLVAEHADILALAAGDDLVVLDRTARGIDVAPVASLDATRRVARVRLDAALIPDDRVLRGGRAVAVRLSRALAAAEAAGMARECTNLATSYAQERVQFGRVIGTFQAVKHHCANMLVETEVATATAWDAAQSLDALADGGAVDQADLATAAAAVLALPAALHCAKLSTQVHGGIAYTWEHDAHLYVRRAHALEAAFGPIAAAQQEVTRLIRAGVRRRPSLALPPEADAIREEVRRVSAEIRALPAEEQEKALIDAGYAFPHWPKPWGRSAGATMQLVCDEELRDLPHPNLGIGAWITQTLAAHGTEEQQARWIRQSELGEIYWCQLFSEPNAGSDAAAIQTRGERTEGGWLVTGQKVWTSVATLSTHGFATVRTNRDAPKHGGVTMMVIDMKAKGVEIRPLRELTGETQFSEVFFDNVFVPDADVVGAVNDGWTVARATLGNERVSIGGGLGGADATELVALIDTHASGDLGYDRQAATLIAQNHALLLLNLRAVRRAVSGGGPGPEGNITKLLTAEHAQLTNDFALALYANETLSTSGAARDRIVEFLQSRQNTIAGGTSEITRNQIAERLLGLPRDPLVK